MRCIQICDRIQDMQVWNVSGSGFRTTVDVTGNVPIKEASCALCGQCITHCPVGALRERDDVDRLFEALADPETVTMVQVAPAVRTAWGEGLGLSREESTTGKLISALRQVGFDYVFDTVYSADLTIMEEGSEFLKRFQDRDSYNWPMFTSCCPGWLRFVKSQYPHLVSNLSTAKSPQQMFGAVAKTYMAQKIGVDPEKIFCVSIMPCVSKKFECDVKQVNDSGYGKDVDLVLTTRELDRLEMCIRDRDGIEDQGDGGFYENRIGTEQEHRQRQEQEYAEGRGNFSGENNRRTQAEQDQKKYHADDSLRTQSKTAAEDPVYQAGTDNHQGIVGKVFRAEQ